MGRPGESCDIPRAGNARFRVLHNRPTRGLAGDQLLQLVALWGRDLHRSRQLRPHALWTGPSVLDRHAQHRRLRAELHNPQPGDLARFVILASALARLLVPLPARCLLHPRRHPDGGQRTHLASSSIRPRRCERGARLHRRRAGLLAQHPCARDGLSSDDVPVAGTGLQHRCSDGWPQRAEHVRP
ncbi:Uncharacterised protein [Chlamydia trachomatis]|nr:Uncharacterised protein [Chlamydia trachomatis]